MDIYNSYKRKYRFNNLNSINYYVVKVLVFNINSFGLLIIFIE